MLINPANTVIIYETFLASGLHKLCHQACPVPPAIRGSSVPPLLRASTVLSSGCRNKSYETKRNKQLTSPDVWLGSVNAFCLTLKTTATLKTSAGRKWGGATDVLYACSETRRDGSPRVSFSGVLLGVPQDVHVSSEVFLQVAGMSHELESGGA